MLSLTLIGWGLCTLGYVATVHYYDGLLKSYKGAIGDYQRALSLARNSPQVALLDEQNKALQSELNALKKDLAGHQVPLQYEHSEYNPTNTTPYVNPWNNAKGSN